MKLWKLADSYQHYRTKTGYGPGHAAYRALYYEIRKKDPKYLSFKDWLAKQWNLDLCYHNWCLRRWNYQYRCPYHQLRR